MRFNSFVDNLPQVSWFVAPTTLFQMELRRLAANELGEAEEALVPVKSSFHRILYEDMKWPYNLILLPDTFVSATDLIEKSPSLREEFGRLQQTYEVFRFVKQTVDNSLRTVAPAIIKARFEDQFQERVFELLPERLSSGRLVSLKERERIASGGEWKDWRKCPAVFLNYKVWQYIGTPAGIKREGAQYVDFLHVGALPYVDKFLCDPKTLAHLNRIDVPPELLGKCFSHLAEALADIE